MEWACRAEQADCDQSQSLFRDLNFPLCCQAKNEVLDPLDLTHRHLRAMSPVHHKYLAKVGERSSTSISIIALSDL